MTFRKSQPAREPRRLGELLEKLSAGRGWGERLALGRLRARWAEIAGETVAARSEPVRLSAGVLTIRAEAGAWATELSLLSASVAGRADAALGGGFVREVRVVSSDPFGQRGRT